MHDRDHQTELDLRPDVREAHAVYRASPPARAGEPRHPLYWAGLLVELYMAYPVTAETR